MHLRPQRGLRLLRLLRRRRHVLQLASLILQPTLDVDRRPPRLHQVGAHRLSHRHCRRRAPPRRNREATAVRISPQHDAAAHARIAGRSDTTILDAAAAGEGRGPLHRSRRRAPGERWVEAGGGSAIGVPQRSLQHAHLGSVARVALGGARRASLELGDVRGELGDPLAEGGLGARPLVAEGFCAGLQLRQRRAQPGRRLLRRRRVLPRAVQPSLQQLPLALKLRRLRFELFARILQRPPARRRLRLGFGEPPSLRRRAAEPVGGRAPRAHRPARAQRARARERARRAVVAARAPSHVAASQSRPSRRAARHAAPQLSPSACAGRPPRRRAAAAHR